MWFVYGTPRNRNIRKGVWLKDSVLKLSHNSLMNKAKKYMRKGEWFDRIIVSEIRPNNQVLLEFWCQSTNPRAIRRYNVFELVVKENPKWHCHGDLGRGLILEKPKC